MIILCDIDDTIEYLLDAWVKYLNNKYGLDKRTEDCYDWDLKVLFPTLRAEDIYSPLVDPKLWESVRPIPGAAEVLKRLQDEGHEIILVTASKHFDVKDKVKYVVDRYFPFIPHDNIVVAHRKQLLRGDVMVDDYPKNLQGGLYKKILFSAPHNRLFNESGTDIKRVYTWEEVYTEIKNIMYKAGK